MKRAAQTFNAHSFVFMKKEHMGLEQHGGENIISGLLILWSWLFSWLWHHCKTVYEIQMQQHGILDIFQWNPFICFSEAPPCVLLWSECVAVGGQWELWAFYPWHTLEPWACDQTCDWWVYHELCMIMKSCPTSSTWAVCAVTRWHSVSWTYTEPHNFSALMLQPCCVLLRDNTAASFQNQSSLST